MSLLQETEIFDRTGQDAKTLYAFKKRGVRSSRSLHPLSGSRA